MLGAHAIRQLRKPIFSRIDLCALANTRLASSMESRRRCNGGADHPKRHSHIPDRLQDTSAASRFLENTIRTICTFFGVARRIYVVVELIIVVVALRRRDPSPRGG